VSQSFKTNLIQTHEQNMTKLVLRTRIVSPSAQSLLTTKGGSLNLRSSLSKSLQSMSSCFLAPVSI